MVSNESQQLEGSQGSILTSEVEVPQLLACSLNLLYTGREGADTATAELEDREGGGGGGEEKHTCCTLP